MIKFHTKKFPGRLSIAIATIALCAGIPRLTFAQDNEKDASTLEEVVVTGFRQSLNAALDRKRLSTGQVDAIVAEDIADFPDLNLAESLQRIPGVAIRRGDDGEGSTITVRGLSGDYTRTRINGMEARAGADESESRDFDYNIFASELFNSIVVRKTASADLEEGSLGSTVDLNTARALDYEEGSTFLLSGTGRYNDLSGETSPRFAGLYSYHDPSDTWGASVSLAYSEVDTQINTNETVRFQKTPFRSVRGVNCNDNPEDAGCMEVRDSFHARIPRYGVNQFYRERVGATAGLQFRWNTGEVAVDLMHATFEGTHNFSTLQATFRGEEEWADIIDYEIETAPGVRGTSDTRPNSNNTIIAMTANNVQARVESLYREMSSEFTQGTINLSQDFTDTFRMTALLGQADSSGERPIDTALLIDIRPYDNFSYDYRDRNRPQIVFGGADVADPNNYQLYSPRDSDDFTESANSTLELNFEWDLSESLTLASGVSYRTFELENVSGGRNVETCAQFSNIFSCDRDGDGLPKELDEDGVPIPDGEYAWVNPYSANPADPKVTDGDLDDWVGIPVSTVPADFMEIIEYSEPVGEGSPTRWANSVVPKWVDYLSYYDVPIVETARRIKEEILGAFVQARGELPFGNARFLYDIGLRYVETDQTSFGSIVTTIDGQAVTVTNLVERPTYDDILPSLNTALWLNDEFVLRFSAAEVMSRPGLGSLDANGSVSVFTNEPTINFDNPLLDPTRAQALDISAEWYFADEALLSVAIFDKSIESFPIRDELFNQTYASTPVPPSLLDPTSPFGDDPEGGSQACNPANGGEGCWTVSKLINGPGASLSGYELSFQSPLETLFGELPPVITDLGILANYTYVDSEVDYTFEGNTVRERLNGLSNSSYNFTLYYEGEKLGARISVAQRSDFITNGPNRNGNLWQFEEPSTHVDFSSSYDITDNFSVNLEVLNVTDETRISTVDIQANRPNEIEFKGRNVLLGARYKF